MQKLIEIATDKHNGLYDITGDVRKIVRESGTGSGIATVYVQGATAAIMMLFILKYPLFASLGARDRDGLKALCSTKKLYL